MQPANPSPAPEVLAKLAEVDEEARENSVHGSPGKNFLERAAVYRAALEAALTALAAATREAERLRERFALYVAQKNTLAPRSPEGPPARPDKEGT